MAGTVQCPGYKAFGLQILSEFALPELPRTDQPGRIGSLSVIEGRLLERWEAIPKITPNLGIAEHEVMFMVKGTAIFPYRTAVRLQSLQQQAQIRIASACSFWAAVWV